MSVCPACQSENPDRARFCSECGAALRSPQAAPPAAQPGSVIKGDHNQALASGSALVQRDVRGDLVMGDKIIMIQPESAPAALRRAYLNHLFEAAGKLYLAGIDSKAASEAQSRISLSAIYTALLTLSSEEMDASAERRPESREARRLSALELLNRHSRLVLLGDPGSGKSTFVNFVALCLAGEALGQAEANLKRLTAPLPSEEEDRPAQETQPWEHGALLPLRVTLRDFAARGLPPAGQAAAARHLWAFIVTMLKDAALQAFEQPLMEELRQEGGLLLLDGLDEVTEAEQRRAQIKQAIEDFASAFPRCRVLVTSRTYAYQRQDWRLRDFSEAALAPFSAAQIRQFIAAWYAHIALLRGLEAEAARGSAALLTQAIFHSDRLRGLAERPLLLTLMASLHAWRGGTLPEKREELYADTVELLLDWWESQRVTRDGQGAAILLQPSLAEWLKVDRQKVRELLNDLAYRAHAAQVDLKGTADILENDLIAGLLRLSQNPDLRPARLVEYLRDRAGLLIPRGVGVYTFPHRTFQEYLAACYLTDHDYPEQVAGLVCGDFNRWREVALLAGAKAARGTTSAIWSLVDALCYEEVQPDGAEASLWGARLAGEFLAEAISVQAVSERQQPKLGRVRRGLLQAMTSDRLPALERARAGASLAVLGDPRPEVMTVAGMQFCFVPAGPFIMGSNAGDPYSRERERPQHEVDLPDYWIGRCPVTNAQYAEFAAAGGYAAKHYWPEAQRAKVWRDGKLEGTRDRPYDYGAPYNLPNHPVVGVTWYEMLAFTRWLEERLGGILAARASSADLIDRQFIQSIAGRRLRAALPSEAEWEKAARGVDGLIYPWVGEFDLNRANVEDAGIGTSSAVGCFPGGASPYGCEEMAGNAWEWTRSLWGKSWEKPDFTYPYVPADGREDLSADLSILRVQRGGCFRNKPYVTCCAYRRRHDPGYWDWDHGFRVVLLLCR